MKRKSLKKTSGVSQEQNDFILTMEKSISTIRRFNQHYRTLSFSELMSKADDEFLELVVRLGKGGHPLEESKFDSGGDLEERNEYRYTASGKLSEHILYYASEDVTERRVLVRDVNDRTIQEVRYYGDDTGERLEYSYDEKGQVVTVVRFDEEGEFDYREEMFYDLEGSITHRNKTDKDGKPLGSLVFIKESKDSIDEKELDAEGRLMTLTTFKYDEKGNETLSEQRKADGSLISGVYTTYDESGKVLERRHKDFFSKIVRYAYDENGRMIAQEMLDASGLLLRKNVYEYDENGRISKEQVFEIDASRGGRDKHYGTRYEYDYFD
ncbi:MAG: hypothetical protein ACKOKF_10085 [Bacteroidota bacterium]